jgi:hypothetical protein
MSALSAFRVRLPFLGQAILTYRRVSHAGCQIQIDAAARGAVCAKAQQVQRVLLFVRREALLFPQLSFTTLQIGASAVHAERTVLRVHQAGGGFLWAEGCLSLQLRGCQRR